jgi:hypothetical protein
MSTTTTVTPPARSNPRPSFPFALAMSAPHALTALIAVAPLVDGLSTATGIPVGMLLITLVQVAGSWLTRELSLGVWRRVWLLDAVACGLLLPLLALLASTSRVPYVSRTWGGFDPVLWTAIGATTVVIGAGILAAALSADQPSEASLLFLPLALLVPAFLGAPKDLGERGSLTVVAEVFVLASVIAFVGWLLPAGLQPLISALALVVQFAILLSFGYRPGFDGARDRLIPALSVALLVVTIVASVAVPLLSMWLRRVIRSAGQSTPSGP